jgi:dipeptidyl aminopeptidase/acylaminoacyl peptidase
VTPSVEEIVEDRTIDSLSVSPDGREVAYRILAPTLASNRLDAIWRRASISASSPPEQLGIPARPSFIPLLAMPKDGVSQWEGAGRGLLVLCEDDHGVQVHRLGPDGFDKRVTDNAADVVDFTFDPQQGKLIYHVRNPRASIDAALKRESEQGIHLDRTVISDGPRITDNFRIGPRTTTIRRLDTNDIAGEPYAGDLRSVEATIATAAGAQDRLSADRSAILQSSLVTQSGAAIRLADGSSIGTIADADSSTETLGARYQRHEAVVRTADGRVIACRSKLCPGADDSLTEITYNPDTKEVVLLAEAGQSALTRVIGWDAHQGSTRLIYSADTSLNGGSRAGASCPRVDHYLLCVEAGATVPERLVRIDLDTGLETILDDPNPILRARHYHRIRQLSWHDASGRRSDGVLVLPDGPTKGPLPLVITTYRCRGYLRGGGSWVTPEQLIASEGMAAICINTNYSGWDNKDAQGHPIAMGAHKAYIEAIGAIVDQLAKEGVIDRERVGISGHSFSSITIAYAISHTSLFKAAVIGAGFDIDRSSYMLNAPTKDSWRKANFGVMGLPEPTHDPEHIWDGVAPSRNAAQVSAALLMQLPESEFPGCLELYTSMQDYDVPVDMFIYPNEAHMVGNEPVHQYWRNRRSVDWFAFWLLGEEHRTRETDAQYDHWEALRASDSRGSGPGARAPADGRDPSHASISTNPRIRE